VKNNVFKNRPSTIPELMQVITDNCNLIDVPILGRSFENTKRRIISNKDFAKFKQCEWVILRLGQR
jgi:hypothetical protein